MGLYNSGDNNSDIGALLQQHAVDDCCNITHELYDLTRKLLVDGTLSYTLEQNARQHAVLSTDLLIRHLEQGLQPDMYQDGRVELRTVTAENLD